MGHAYLQRSITDTSLSIGTTVKLAFAVFTCMCVFVSGASASLDDKVQDSAINNSTINNSTINNTTKNIGTLLPDGVLLGDIDALNPNVPPSENFDLLDWNLGLPVDSDKNGRSDTIPERILANGFELRPLFFTANDGGLVFICPNYGAKTSKNTAYVRTELREMLRRGNARIGVQGVTKNNWVLSSAHGSVRRKAGGIDGSLEATVAVNRVSTTGEPKKVGRVIIGQIHGKDDEPLRIYYRKLPDNELGSVYFAHEIVGGDEIWIDLVGSRASNAKNPVDGIALNELFSYRVELRNDILSVTLIRQGQKNITRTVDISESHYDKSSEYMYFKLGVYNQNNSGEENDFAQATFYHFENKHEGYRY